MTSGTWQNRIVAYTEIAPNILLPNAKNWRLHPDEQEQALQAILSEIGIVQNVIVNARTSKYRNEDGQEVIPSEDDDLLPYVDMEFLEAHLVDGHLRTGLAIKNNQPVVPVTLVDLTLEEEDAILATYDPVTEMAKVDAERLRDLHERFHVQNEQLQAMLAEIADRAGIYATEFVPLETDAIHAANPFSEKTYVARKQVSILYSLPEHEEFEAAIRVLGAHYATDSIAETLLATVKDAAATVPTPTVGPKREKRKKLTESELPKLTVDTPKSIETFAPVEEELEFVN